MTSKNLRLDPYGIPFRDRIHGQADMFARDVVDCFYDHKDAGYEEIVVTLREKFTAIIDETVPRSTFYTDEPNAKTNPGEGVL
jgi:hypothetical protein